MKLWFAFVMILTSDGEPAVTRLWAVPPTPDAVQCEEGARADLFLRSEDGELDPSLHYFTVCVPVDAELAGELS